MTNRDILTTILSEVSGKTPSEIGAILRHVEATFPNSLNKLDVEVPDAEAEELLTALRREKSCILNWILQGRKEALAEIQQAAPRN